AFAQGYASPAAPLTTHAYGTNWDAAAAANAASALRQQSTRARSEAEWEYWRDPGHDGTENMRRRRAIDSLTRLERSVQHLQSQIQNHQDGPEGSRFALRDVLTDYRAADMDVDLANFSFFVRSEVDR